MLECLILGDSIGVGTHYYYNQINKKAPCESVSKGGYNTWQWNKKFQTEDLTAKTVIISLGTNDHQYVKTEEELLKIRNRVVAERVYWIMPAIKPHIQEIVKKIAQDRGDWIVPIKSLHTDKIHPSTEGYKEIVKSVR